MRLTIDTSAGNPSWQDSHTSSPSVFDHTAGPRGRAAVVMVSQFAASSTMGVRSVTYGRIQMKLIAAYDAVSAAGATSMWWLNNIPRGTQQVRVNWYGSADDRSVACVTLAAAPHGVGIATKAFGTGTTTPIHAATTPMKHSVGLAICRNTANTVGTMDESPSGAVVIREADYGNAGTHNNYRLNVGPGRFTQGVALPPASPGNEEADINLVAFYALTSRSRLRFQHVAVAGGLSIPVAMHHYTKNIGPR